MGRTPFPRFASGKFMRLLLITGQTRTPRVIGARVICVWHFLQPHLIGGGGDS